MPDESRPEVSVWFNPSCSTCRPVEGLLAERGVTADDVRYLDAAPGRAELERVLARPPERVLELLARSADTAARPASNRATGNRNGEQET